MSMTERRARMPLTGASPMNPAAPHRATLTALVASPRPPSSAG
jgi:hypothetical protein